LAQAFPSWYFSWTNADPFRSGIKFQTISFRATRVVIIIIIIIIIIVVSFMHGIHTHIPETNHVPRGYIVAAILSLLFMVPLFLVPALALLFFYVSTFRSMCAVPNMVVFCSSLTSWFPGMSLTYFVNDLEMVPVAPIITGITLVFTFHYYYYY
jgi:hypothetical protein